MHTFSPRFGRAAAAALLLCGLAAGSAQAGDTTPQQQLQRWQAQAGSAGQAARGQQFFNAKHGYEWSCASCHNAPPTTAAKHAGTGKAISALAPSANAERLTDSAKVDKWFRRNCNDVLKRECSAQEKADVLAYLIELR